MQNIVTLIAICSLLFANGQQHTTNAINPGKMKVERLDSLSKEVYNLLTDYRLIMIGEMHGTNEPSMFVTGLAELLATNGDSVQVGFEIPADMMGLFLKERTDSSVFYSDFFQHGFDDGRSTVAMANAISRLKKNPRVKVFFYDITAGSMEERDSIMYVNVKSRMKENGGWKTITLSGNIHNLLQPHRTGKKMGYYLNNDKELSAHGKVCSLNQDYQSGTMLNNTGNGLELRRVGNPSNTGIEEKYLYLLPAEKQGAYSGIYFTTTVTAAELVEHK